MTAALGGQAGSPGNPPRLSQSLQRRADVVISERRVRAPTVGSNRSAGVSANPLARCECCGTSALENGGLCVVRTKGSCPRIESEVSVAQACPTLCEPMNRSTPGLPVHHQLRSSLRLTSIESVMPSSHLILCHPLLLLPPISPSIRVFSNESTLRIRWPKYWSFSFSIIPSKEHPGLISFRMDWLDLLAVQGTLRSLLQHHSSKVSILQCSAFFTIQLSHPYRTTGKTIDLTRRTFVGKVVSLLFNMLSRLVITFLPRSKHLLISWLQSPFAVILEPPKIKSDTVSPSISHEVMGPDAIILLF
ncbi:uncharacterized protein LOC129621162 isoform X1 [Bubalus kerabau]|uniref:uncharacterized protein LOC129621162 isoform X1 n=1 Tax=Bubalus carabanensis TaxID=3119969 RepID=UPI00244E8A1A|nr:uncharacterized protein LOC129621162 isoform X1 [Bubalus carabanensis]